MRVLITGATGKVGGRLARHLAACGHAVRALVRTQESASGLTSAAIDIAVGDVTVPHSLPAATAGAEAVIHCAALSVARRPNK